MMGTPREKDAWITSLKEKLGDRYTYDVPREGKTVTLERTESAKRREIQSMPRWGNEPTEQIIRSYSTGSTGPVHRPSFRKPITEFAPLHDEDTVSFLSLFLIAFVYLCVRVVRPDLHEAYFSCEATLSLRMCDKYAQKKR